MNEETRVACFVFFQKKRIEDVCVSCALSCLVGDTGGASTVFEGLFPVRLLFFGFADGRPRFGGLGVRCRWSPFPFPLPLVIVLERAFSAS